MDNIIFINLFNAFHKLFKRSRVYHQHKLHSHCFLVRIERMGVRHIEKVRLIAQTGKKSPQSLGNDFIMWDFPNDTPSCFSASGHS